MTDKLHLEHRKRMKERFENYGFEAFQDHEALEYLLFYALPYKNTNGMAHELINKFGSFSGVFSASIKELQSVKGIGRHAALFIEMLPQFCRRYTNALNTDRQKCETKETISEYVINHFIGETKEHVQLFLFDSFMHRTGSITLYNGSFSSSHINSEGVADYIFSNRASYFVIAHNHPSGDTLPSYEDLIVTREIYRALHALNREMIEHYIVAEGRCEPILDAAKEMFDK